MVGAWCLVTRRWCFADPPLRLVALCGWPPAVAVFRCSLAARAVSAAASAASRGVIQDSIGGSRIRQVYMV